MKIVKVTLRKRRGFFRARVTWERLQPDGSVIRRIVTHAAATFAGAWWFVERERSAELAAREALDEMRTGGRA